MFSVFTVQKVLQLSNLLQCYRFIDQYPIDRYDNEVYFDHTVRQKQQKISSRLCHVSACRAYCTQRNIFIELHNYSSHFNNKAVYFHLDFQPKDKHRDKQCMKP